MKIISTHYRHRSQLPQSWPVISVKGIPSVGIVSGGIPSGSCLSEEIPRQLAEDFLLLLAWRLVIWPQPRTYETSYHCVSILFLFKL